MSVNNVANASPPIMQTAISLKKASDSNGDIPMMVVPAANITGRRRLTQAATMDSRLMPSSSICLSISSTRTTQFLINIPDKLRNPKNDGKVNDKSVMSRLSTTPQTVIGTVNQITIDWRSLPNIKMVTKNINAKVTGILAPRVSLAS